MGSVQNKEITSSFSSSLERSSATRTNNSVPEGRKLGGGSADKEISLRASGGTSVSPRKAEAPAAEPSTVSKTMTSCPKHPSAGPGNPIANPLLTPPSMLNAHNKQASKSAVTPDDRKIAAQQERSIRSSSTNNLDSLGQQPQQPVPPATNSASGGDRQRSVLVPTPPWAIAKRGGGANGPPHLRRVYQNQSSRNSLNPVASVSDTAPRPAMPYPSPVVSSPIYTEALSSPPIATPAIKKQRPPEEDLLSDISNSDSLSTHGSQSIGQKSPRRFSAPFGFFGNKGDDIEQERNRNPVSIEEDLFVYDDIVISTDEARTKHWRLAGRKGGLEVTSSPNTTTDIKKTNFSFNDFVICVDEMDLAPSTTDSAAGIKMLLNSLDTQSGEKSESHGDYSVTWTQPRHSITKKTATEGPSSPPTQPAPVKEGRQIRNVNCTPLRGHATRVKCISLSPSEKDFVSCSNEDASVRLSNFSVKDEVGIFTGHRDTVICTAFSPDGKLLATTSKDRTMKLWDVVTTKFFPCPYKHPKVVICCCFSPNSRYIVSGCQDRVCRVFRTHDRDGKELLQYRQHEGIVISVAFSPDCNYVCSASADSTLRVWSFTCAKTKFTLLGHKGIILSCRYSTDGSCIISNDESQVRVWSAEDGSCQLSLTPEMLLGSPYFSTPYGDQKIGWTLSAAAPGAFTDYIVVACNNRFVYVIDRRTGEEVYSVFCKAPVYCLSSGWSEMVACGDSFGNIYMLRLS